MNRHTLNDGVTADRTITGDMYDEWWPDLSAPPALLGDYYKRGLPWEDFESQYLEHLSDPKPKEQLHRLTALAVENNVTILCTEDTPEFCHRRLLISQCRLILPTLDVQIL